MAVNKNDIMSKCLDQISKQYPSSTIGRYSEIGKKVSIKTTSTGSISADHVLGGGFSRISEVVGYPSTGKTTLALTAIAERQRNDPDAQTFYLDAEYTLDPVYAKALGVDMERMILCQPDSTIEGYNIMESMIQSGVLDIAVLDSIAAMIPPEYSEGEIGDKVKIASFAALTTQAIARINRISSKFDTHVIFINQYKDAVSTGPFSGGSGTVMGNSAKYAPGGPSKDFYFQQILETKRTSQIKRKDGTVVSNVYGIKTLKNKVAPPYRFGEICITFGVGLDRLHEIVGLGITQGVVSVNGRMHNLVDLEGNPLYPDLKPFNGKQALIGFLTDKPDILDVLEGMIRQKLSSFVDDGNNQIRIDKGVIDE